MSQSHTSKKWVNIFLSLKWTTKIEVTAKQVALNRSPAKSISLATERTDGDCDGFGRFFFTFSTLIRLCVLISFFFLFFFLLCPRITSVSKKKNSLELQKLVFFLERVCAVYTHTFFSLFPQTELPLADIHKPEKYTQ